MSAELDFKPPPFSSNRNFPPRRGRLARFGSTPSPPPLSLTVRSRLSAMGSGRVQEGADPPDAGKTPLHEIFEDPISKILTLEVPQGRVPDKLCFFLFVFFLLKEPYLMYLMTIGLFLVAFASHFRSRNLPLINSQQQLGNRNR